jgi:hypothetical protein
VNKVRVQRLISDTLLSGASGSIRDLRELASPILADLVPYLSAGPARTLVFKPENHVGGPDLHSGYKLGRNQTCREGSGTLSQENLLPRTPPYWPYAASCLACCPPPKLWLPGSILGESYTPKSLALPHTELRLITTSVSVSRFCFLFLFPSYC